MAERTPAAHEPPNDVPAGASHEPPYEVYTALLGHELRTPVATLQVYLHLLEQERIRTDPEALTEYLEVIAGQVRHLSGLVTELTTFANLSAGYGPQPAVDEPQTVLELLNQLSKGQRVRLEIEPDAATAPVEMERLRVILEQLVSNALRHGSQDEPVLIRACVCSEPSKLEVLVINQGEPIPDAIREHIFGAYRQGETPRERRYGGLGLGLTVARSAAEGGHGTLRLEPGSPTTFRLELPLREDPVASLARTSQAAAAAAESQAVRAIQDVHTLRGLIQQERRARRQLEEQLAAALQRADELTHRSTGEAPRGA